MSRWIQLLLLALALSLVIAEDKADEEKDEETSEPQIEEENKKPMDGMTDKEREAMMERMQNIHLYHDAFLGENHGSVVISNFLASVFLNSING